jgi:hypothetical protein
MMEVKLDSNENAAMIRKAFAEKRSKKELHAAYSRVGNAFEGQVAQNFVVLNNQDHDYFRSGTSGAPGSSGYRPDQQKRSFGARGSGKQRGGYKRAGDEMGGHKDKHKKS